MLSWKESNSDGKNAIRLIVGPLVSQMNMFPTPEKLEDGFHRLRSFVPYSLNDEDRNRLNIIIDAFTRRRFRVLWCHRELRRNTT